MIKTMRAREVLDSRGWLTLEVELHLDNGGFGRFIVPAGMSKGKAEAVALYDDNARKTLHCAIRNVEVEIANSLCGHRFASQRELDELLINLDGTSNKSRLGANSLLGISIAYAKAVADSKNIPLFQHISDITGAIPGMPSPFVNVINGGAHASNGLQFQEFMLVAPKNLRFKDKILAIRDVFICLYDILRSKSYSVSVGDEGGFAPPLSSEIEALDLLSSAIAASGADVSLALDVAANHFYNGSHYILNGKYLNSSQFVDYYEYLVERYNIISIEDPMAEEDMDGWAEMTRRLGHKIQIIGDDVFVTNSSMLAEGIKMGIANSILIKPNQIGTLTETCDTVLLAVKHGYKTMISHRSGDTEDTTIAHLAVGMNSGQIKSGSLCRSERTAKYNELLRIEEGLVQEF